MGRAFGTAGVRGVFNVTQTPAQVYELAETVAFAFGNGRYGVGWDGRKVSTLLARTVMSAVNAVGSDVFSFGMVPTPVVAFGARSRSCLVGFAVTASHNPPEFSGVKVFNGKGMELNETDESRIERAMVVGTKKSGGSFGMAVQDSGILEEYREALVSRHSVVSNPLRIVVDCGSGPGSLVTPAVLAALGHSVVPVNGQVSWRFPARPPEPTAENLSDFGRVVSAMHADLGLAHDGDADRLVMVGPLGTVIPDSVASMIAMHAIGASSGNVVISENTSSAVQEEAENLGFSVVRTRVGKTFAVLEERGGVMATEPSKVVDPNWGFWEDGMNAAVMISRALSEDRGLLGRLVAQNKWTYRQVNVAGRARMAVLKVRTKEAFKRSRILEERMVDGYKIVFHDESWVMFRPSGTEPKTRLYCESKDPGVLEALVQEGTKCIESSL